VSTSASGNRTAGRITAGGPHYYSLAPDSDVGGEVYERMLLERLPAHGVDVALRHRAVHWTRAPLAYAPYVIGLIRSGEVQLLRGHSVRHTGPSLLLARALTRSKLPIVLHHHHLDARWAGLEAAIARRADAVITVSEHSRHALSARGVPEERIHVVPQGIARPPATEGWPDAWPGEGLRLLHLGRLEARKRPALALETLASLRRSGVAASLVLAGGGPLTGELINQAALLGVTEATRFVGRVSDAAKWRLYDSADVLLFGSTLEGFGLVVAEAQSRGVPVVAARGTATAEAFEPGETGLLAEPTGEAFAEAVRELGDDRARRAMGERARAFARRFDWDACAEAVAEVYRGLVGD
jgi:glycosyltransferase involved in cell wall biosynthesis